MSQTASLPDDADRPIEQLHLEIEQLKERVAELEAAASTTFRELTNARERLETGSPYA